MFRIVLVLIVFSNKIIAQNPAFKWSDKTTIKGDVNFCGTKQGLLFTTVSNGKTVTIQSYNADLSLKGETNLPFDNSDNPDEYLMSFVADSQIVHVKYNFSKKDKLCHIFFDKTNFDFTPHSSHSSFATIKADKYHFIQAYYSPDRSKLLIHNQVFNAKTGMIDWAFSVVNVSTSTLLYSDVLSFNSYKETLENFSIDNAGNLYFQLTEYFREGSKLFGKPKTKNRVLVFLTTGNKKEFSFDNQGKYFSSIDIVQGDDNNIYFVGLAYDEATSAGRLSASEMLIAKYNPSLNKVTDSSFVTINGLFPDRRLDENDRIPYSIRNIYKKMDGGYIIVAEQYQMIIKQYSNLVKYNDIACIQLKDNFTVESVTRIPKLQFGGDNASMLCNYVHNKLYILYSDHLNNLDATQDKLQYPAGNKEKNGLFLITLEAGGSYKKELLYGYDSGKPMPIIKKSFSINEHSIFLTAADCIGLLTFTR